MVLSRKAEAKLSKIGWRPLLPIQDNLATYTARAWMSRYGLSNRFEPGGHQKIVVIDKSNPWRCSLAHAAQSRGGKPFLRLEHSSQVTECSPPLMRQDDRCSQVGTCIVDHQHAPSELASLELTKPGQDGVKALRPVVSADDNL
jgi:hypothetical protein